VHPPERRLNAPIFRDVSEETVVMDDLDEHGKRKGWTENED
jgi:hypothetical protein